MKVESLVLSDEEQDSLGVSLAASFMSFLLGLFYFIVRFGFGNNSFVAILKTVGLAFFLLLLPEFVNLVRGKLSLKTTWYNSGSFVLICAVLILFLLGLLSSWVNLQYFIIVLGFFFFVICSSFLVRSLKEKSKLLLMFLFATLLSLWIAGVVWDGHYLTPLFIEKLISDGNISDTLFHSSITGQIKTHFIPSTGLDGIPYIKYHWGSHYLFAGIAKLIDSTSLDFYNLVYPVLFAPFVVRSYVHLISSIKRYLKVSPFFSWKESLAIIIAFTGAVSSGFSSKSGIFIENIFLSQSYALGVSFAFLFIALLLSAGHRPFAKTTKFIFIPPILLAIIGLFKISIFILLMVAVIYFFFRMKLYRKPQVIISIALSLILACVVIKISYLGGDSKIDLLNYLKRWVNKDLRPLFLITYFFWIWVYLFARFKALGVRSLRDLASLYSRKKFIDVELLLIIALAGILPGMIFDIPGGSAFYFSDFQRWLALALVIAALPLLWPRDFLCRGVINIKISHLIFFTFLACFSFSSFKNIKGTFFAGFVKSNVIIRDKITSQTSRVKWLSQVGRIKYLINQENHSLSDAIKLIAGQAQEGVNSDKRYKLASLLAELSQVKDKKKTAVFIPQDNYLYWNLTKINQVQFVAPALTELPLIGGIQPFIPQRLERGWGNGLEQYLKKAGAGSLSDFYNVPENSLTGRSSKLTLKQDLHLAEEKESYDLLSPYFYKFLKNYGYWSYEFPTQAQYEEKYSTDEGICRQAREKNFSKIIIIYTDSDQNPQKRELSCT